ncbi:hypothetical protein [Roseicitreum antarcticum]|uniref:Clp protease n=1 Tax=Roseicitreum antarcticum TaxID=564137 RepID=A0A1H3EVB1_9RHOB|nr:hypothetical protein [Roseicitreum antarcticum]SDX82676.1 hypothetical protein SAMN04488238_1278 [Roseicitreum antarcticum]
MQNFKDKISDLTIGRGLKIILFLQVVVALFLIVTDVAARWHFNQMFDGSEPTSPVAPGDQVRRYDPTRPTPQFSNPGTRPDIDLPEDLPPRLEFMIEQDPELGTLLVMNGAIEAGDAGRLAAYLADLDSMPDAIAINSPGGIVDEALAIGQLIRTRELDTRILPGMGCFSSCPYVLAGGVERHVSLSGAVGLHQHYYETPGYMPVFFAVENIQRGQGATMGFLIEMGIDPGIMIHSLRTPPNDIYVLVESELLESRIATTVTE